MTRLASLTKSPTSLSAENASQIAVQKQHDAPLCSAIRSCGLRLRLRYHHHHHQLSTQLQQNNR